MFPNVYFFPINNIFWKETANHKIKIALVKSVFIPSHKNELARAVVVVKWSACLTSTPTIRVRIPMKPKVFSVNLCLKRMKIRRGWDAFFLKKNDSAYRDILPWKEVELAKHPFVIWILAPSVKQIRDCEASGDGIRCSSMDSASTDVGWALKLRRTGLRRWFIFFWLHSIVSDETKRV